MDHQHHHQDTSEQAVRSLRLSRIAWPVAIGIVAVGYLFYTQFDQKQFERIVWDFRAWAWVGLAVGLLALRHLSYSLRMKAVTGDVFTWKKSIEVVTIWEFSGLLAPTSKGGPLVAMLVLPKEGVTLGATVAAVIYTIILDTGFFVLLLPVLGLLFGEHFLFPPDFGAMAVAGGAFFFIYGLMAMYWLFLTTLVFLRPEWTPRVFTFLSKLPIFRRWKSPLEQLGFDIALAASGLRQAGWRLHFRVILGTLGAWTCKFAMINCLMLAIAPEVPLDGYTQLLVYARMVAMFIIMTFSPTPGGAGLAEVALPRFISDFMPLSLGLVVALMWRGMAYYGYLLAGAIVTPAWVARHYRRSKQ